MTKVEKNLKKLQKYFAISKENDRKIISPGKVTYNPDKAVNGKVSIDDIKIKPIEMPSEVKKAYDYFKSDYLSTSKNKKDRFDRYADLDFMTKNEGIMRTACQLYADESVQVDEQNRVISINARKKEVESHFYTWFESVGFTKGLLHDIAWNLAEYGDSFLINSIDLSGGGVTEIVPLSVYNVFDRLEFNAVKVKEFMKNSGYTSSFDSFLNKNNSFKDLYDAMTNESNENYATAFKSYLFGYNVNDDFILPPWCVSHFRLYTTDDLFHPFGMSIFLGSIARYKSYKTTEMLMDMARVASFPKEIYTISTTPGMSLVDIFSRVNLVREQFLNITSDTRNPDDLSVGEPIFTVDGLFEYDLMEADIDIDKISDYEKKREDLIISTGIPEGYLILGDRGSFGESGKSLLQQSKLFGRRVYTIHSAMLEEITNLYRLHLLLTGMFEQENTDFELSMSFPVMEESDEYFERKTDSLDLASAVIEKVGEILGLDRDETLPIEIVKDIYNKYSFLDNSRLDQWIKTIEKQRKEKSVEELQEIDKKVKKIKEKIKNRPLNESILRETYFTVKKNSRMDEGIANKKHFYSSWSKSNKLFEDSLNLLRKDILYTKRLREDKEKDDNLHLFDF